MDAETRKQRSAALEEKRRRLEELKKRRTKRGEDTAKVKAQLGGSNLDEYIDGLLQTQPPAGTAQAVAAAGAAASSITPSQSKDEADTKSADGSTAAEGDASAEKDDNKSAASGGNVIAERAPAPPPKVVECFTIGTQTEDEDFPEPLDDEDEEDEDKDEEERKRREASGDVVDPLLGGSGCGGKPVSGAGEEKEKDPKLLSTEEVQKEVSSEPFSTFINSASKKVERMLGTGPLLGDLLVDYYVGEDDEDDDEAAEGGEKGGTKKKGSRRRRHSAKDASDDSRFVSSRQVFECPVWTAGRDITDVDWSPLHRELFLSTYNHNLFMSSQSSTSASASANITKAGSATAAAGSSVSPNDTTSSSSSSLTPRTGELQSDGLLLVWNLTMPNRPEHVFTCGSSVISGKFHPVDSPLMMGGCDSGQIVVWDARAGRLPVQKSALSSTVAGSSTSSSGTASSLSNVKGHVYPIDGMEIIEGGLGLVTSSADGRVNYWSLSNLREPVESIQVSDSVSCFTVMPETECLLLGDENGGIFSAQSASSAATSASAQGQDGGASSSSTSAGTSSGRSSSRKQIRKFETADESGENFGHYGMVTSLSAKTLKKGSASRTAGLSKGFLKGSGGLVLSSGVDWTVKLWAPAFNDLPLLSHVSHSYDYMSDAQWCPNHSSLFATASCNGTIGLWNLANSLEEPITGSEGLVIESTTAATTTTAGSSSGQQQAAQSQQAAQQRGLNKLKWSTDGRRLAVASSDRVHMLTMTEDVVRQKPDDDTKMMNQLMARGLIVSGSSGTTAATTTSSSKSTATSN